MSTRIELGRMKYEMSRFDLKDLVSNIVKEIQPNIDREIITWFVSIAFLAVSLVIIIVKSLHLRRQL